VSYEIPMAICALVPVIVAGTLNMVDIGRMQSGWFTNWFLFHDPFCCLAFFVYFTVATASVKRAPFDLAEAESELVAGFHTEYSGIRWSYFFMAEYASMFAVSGIATALFLGGWYTGIAPIDEGLFASIREVGGSPMEGVTNIGNYVVNVIGLTIFLVKGSALVFFQIWIRWTLPRLRIDQVMTTCLKYLLPISCFLLVGVSVWPLLLNSCIGRTTLVPGEAAALGNKVPHVMARVAVSQSAAVVSPPIMLESPSSELIYDNIHSQGLPPSRVIGAGGR